MNEIAPRTLCYVVGIPAPYLGRVVEVVARADDNLYPVDAAWLRELLGDGPHLMRSEYLRPIVAAVEAGER